MTALAGADYRPLSEVVIPPVQLTNVETGNCDILFVMDDIPRAGEISFEEGLASRQGYWESHGGEATHVIFIKDIVSYPLSSVNDVASWLPCQLKELWFCIWNQADFLGLDWDGVWGPAEHPVDP